MHRRSSKKKQSDLENELHDVPPDRPGLPAKDSIQSVDSFVSPQGEEYKILHTNETDAYDAPPTPRAARKSRRMLKEN